MKKLLFIFCVSCLGYIAAAQENRISTNKIDTLPTTAPADRVVVPSAGQKIEAAKRRSNSEMNAEIKSKSKTQSLANEKPNPYEKPLTEPTSSPTSGNAIKPSPNK